MAVSETTGTQMWLRWLERDLAKVETAGSSPVICSESVGAVRHTVGMAIRDARQCARAGCDGTVKGSKQKHCSIRCGNLNRARKVKPPRGCANPDCSATFEVVRGGEKRKYCSKTCAASVSNRGRSRTRYDESVLCEVIASAATWSDVARAIGRSTSGLGELRRVADRLDIDYSHLEGRVGNKSVYGLPPAANVTSRDQRNLADIAEAQAAAWFVERGATVSIPMTPTTYDMIVDWGEGLQKVQVKSGTGLRASRYAVRLVKTKFMRNAPGDGRYAQVPYEKGDLDWFFIVTADRSMYLVPWEAVEGQASISVPGVYERYKLH